MKEIKTISAALILRAISAGKTGRQLMRKFDLSQRQFHSVINQLLAEKQRRSLRILADWRTGLTVAQLADKHGFLAERFGNILKRLEDQGLLSDDEGARKDGTHCTTCAALDRRAFPRLYRPVLTTKVYDVAVPEKTGLILDLSQSGIAVSGINSQVGREKVMFVNVGDFVEDEMITFKCRCRWTSASDKAQKAPCAGFEITSISKNNSGYLKTILAAEIALTQVA